MSGKAPYITIDFFPAGSKQPRLRPIAAKLDVTDVNRQAALKLGFFSKDIAGGADGGEHIAIVCHDPKVAAALAVSLRQAASELDAAIAKAINPFSR